VRGALASLKNGNDGNDFEATIKKDTESIGSRESEYNVLAICCDTTCCSVVALSSDYKPLRPCLLWMDARSAVQARQIMDIAGEAAKVAGEEITALFPSLRVNSAGQGPISAEWLLPKAMWIKQHEPSVYESAEVICEYQDYINYRLTGRMVASSCNAAVRWHHDGWEVSEGGKEGDGKENDKLHAGRPMKLYRELKMEELAEKLPRKTLAMGEVIGGLTEKAASDLGLSVGTLVVQGGPDAFVGMIGLGAIHPGDLCLITGSSHLHCLITPYPTSAAGTWGAYRGAPLPHLNFAEGGQSSTGSLVRWVRDLVSSSIEDGEKVSYQVLDEEAGEIAPGSDGLVALETWQGSRTPHTDPLARGAFVGLTLSHTRAHMFRAIMESVCYGTRACFDALEAASQQHSELTSTSGTRIKSDEVVIAGGATRSPLWLQLHADITGKTFLLNENTDGPLLGCAILASVGAGVYGSVDEAVKRMVRRERSIEPRDGIRKTYDKLYKNVYLRLRPGVKDVVHTMAELRGGASTMASGETKSIIRVSSGIDSMKVKQNNISGKHCPNNLRGGDSQRVGSKANAPVISPSLLASDWSDIKGEVQKCIDAGVKHLHLDVFDGVFLDSPHALTFGPQMIRAIHDRFREDDLTLDIHLCVHRPERYTKAMADAGATRIIFQWEAMRGDQLRTALEIAYAITLAGLSCGVSINPETPISAIYPLLDTGLVDLVDILAVEPGFGGQNFNPLALQKIANLRSWINDRLTGRGIDIRILVDGGVNNKTSRNVVEAGADILVAGTALFRHRSGFAHAINELVD